MISTAVNRDPCGKAFIAPLKTFIFLFFITSTLVFQQTNFLLNLLFSTICGVLTRTNSTTSTTVLNYLLIEE